MENPEYIYIHIMKLLYKYSYVRIIIMHAYYARTRARVCECVYTPTYICIIVY